MINDGVQLGEFTCPDERVANMTIQGAMNLAPSWYRRHPSAAARNELIENMVVTLLRVVGVIEPQANGGRSANTRKRG